MSVDMTIGPWDRLIKLAPPGTNPDDLASAALRYALTADVFAAAADLWEEAAMLIDTTPDELSNEGISGQAVKSVSQDGISVTYSDEGLVGNSMSSRIAQQAQYMAKARYFRSRAKAKTVDMHDPLYDPFRGMRIADPETVIVVNEVTEL